MFEEKYRILRTDYSDGLLDKDGNGIDDRDPYNSCGYTDLNFNCIADGAVALDEYQADWLPLQVESNRYKYSKCPHGVVNGKEGGLCDAQECVDYRARRATWTIR